MCEIRPFVPLFQQGYKAGLLEMVIAGQCLGNAVALHDHERDAIGERPFLVGTLGIEIRPILQKGVRAWFDGNVRVRTDVSVQSHKLLAPAHGFSPLTLKIVVTRHSMGSLISCRNKIRD